MRACCGEIRSRGGERRSRGDEMRYRGASQYLGVRDCGLHRNRRLNRLGLWLLLTDCLSHLLPNNFR